MIKRSIAVAVSVLFVSCALVFTARTQSLPPLPAPVVDRIGFPTDYQNTFLKLYTFDNFQNRQIRVIWANPIAASVRPSIVYNFPYGSIILFESYSVQEED